MREPIAVVISTYNNPDFLRLVLNGYAQQSDTNFVIYIADDGSTEETHQLIHHMAKGFPVPIHHVWHEDHGFRKARIHNITFSQIAEPYILLTDGDCIPLPHMVATHRRLAQQNCMINGSRILLSAEWTTQLTQSELFSRPSLWGWWQLKRQKRVNRILPIFLPPHLSASTPRLSGIHGCHFACFRDDLLRVNGYDESFEGWGREDSDLVARLFHAGVQRRNLRGTPVLHLWHHENSRDHLQRNDALLASCLKEKRVEARRGIRQIHVRTHEKL